MLRTHKKPHRVSESYLFHGVDSQLSKPPKICIQISPAPTGSKSNCRWLFSLVILSRHWILSCCSRSNCSLPLLLFLRQDSTVLLRSLSVLLNGSLHRDHQSVRVSRIQASVWCHRWALGCQVCWMNMGGLHYSFPALCSRTNIRTTTTERGKEAK